MESLSMPKAGGDFYCRICNTTHRSATVHTEVSPLQISQMACEKFEEIVETGILLTTENRREIEVMLKKIRNILGIPPNPIYEEDQNPHMPSLDLFMEDGDFSREKAKEEREEKVRKLKEERKYAPDSEQIRKAKEALESAKNIIIQKGVMEKRSEKLFNNGCEELSEALKLQ